MKGQPVILNNNNTTEGCRFVGNRRFQVGIEVPIYEVSSIHAFNQLIGYAKYLNAHYGNVYYRGVNGLFDNVKPSIMRKRTRGIAQDIKDLIGKIYADPYLPKSLHLHKEDKVKTVADYAKNHELKRNNKYRIEGLLQHYTGKTRFIDVVDNHWVALWMGLHDFIECGEGGQYVTCRKRTVDTSLILDNLVKRECILSDQFLNRIYEYIILLAMPYPEKIPLSGVIETEELVEVDLRKALPSFFLRPHAQHAMVIRKRDIEEKVYDANYYDMASQVIGILRIRTDYADKWLGYGELVTKENMFPSPSLDSGYNSLLKNDLFDNNFIIKKYF